MSRVDAVKMFLLAALAGLGALQPYLPKGGWGEASASVLLAMLAAVRAYLSSPSGNGHRPGVK